MAIEINEEEIRRTVNERKLCFTGREDKYTPSGKPRTTPQYYVSVSNSYLDTYKEIKASSPQELEQKAREQLAKWNEQEIKSRILQAKADALSDAEEYWKKESEEVRANIDNINNLLLNSIKSFSHIDPETFYDKRQYPSFCFRPEPFPTKPSPYPDEPHKSLLDYFFPKLFDKKNQRYVETIKNIDKENAFRKQGHEKALDDWRRQREMAREADELKRSDFLKKQADFNRRIQYFIDQYHAGNPKAAVKYLKKIFELQQYPKCFQVEHEISFDSESRMAVIDISLPEQDLIPNITDYIFKKTTGEGQPVKMKPKDYDAFYDLAIKQVILRTINIVLASTEPNDVSGVVVNGWVTYLEKATGTDKTSCIISVSTDRNKFSGINLERVNPGECIKNLRGLVAGPLSQVAPVQPILHLNREDKRFVESQEILANINSQTNIAEIGWEEFEHLVRELFGAMFSEHGEEVRVTQSSRDGGVDAIAFDPDPIRGGKFVIQAKRYTSVVPVSAVRDLYGTMISEGATKGLLVTTAHFGTDSREFVKDKPISLIDGSNLVFLLEKYGYKVRIDVKEARSKLDRNPLAR